MPSFPKVKIIRLRCKQMSELRERVLERDKACVDCGRTYWLEMSHDIPRSLGGSDTLENCHMRCRPCHRKRDGHGQPMHF